MERRPFEAGLSRENWEDDLWGELRDDDEGDWVRDGLAYEHEDLADD